MTSYHILVNRIAGFVRKNASGKTGHNFLNFEKMAGGQNIVVDMHVISLN